MDAVRARDAGGLRERGRGDARRPVAEPAVDANTLLASLVAGGLGVLAASVTQLDSTHAAAADRPGAGGGAVRPVHLVRDRLRRRPAIGVPRRDLLPVDPELVPEDQGSALPGVKDLFVFVVIVIALFWRGASLPGPRRARRERLPLGAPAGAPVPPGGHRHRGLRHRARRPPVRLPAGADQQMIGVDAGALGRRHHRLRRPDLAPSSSPCRASAGFAISRLATESGSSFPLAPLIAARGVTLLGLLTAVSALRVRGVSWRW